MGSDWVGVEEQEVLELVILHEPRPIPVKPRKKWSKKPILKRDVQLRAHIVQILNRQLALPAPIKLVKHLFQKELLMRALGHLDQFEPEFADHRLDLLGVHSLQLLQRKFPVRGYKLAERSLARKVAVQIPIKLHKEFLINKPLLIPPKPASNLPPDLRLALKPLANLREQAHLHILKHLGPRQALLLPDIQMPPDRSDQPLPVFGEGLD
jgi:hypothetical protein